MDSNALCIDCGTSWVVAERADVSDFGCLRCGGSLAPIPAPQADEERARSAVPTAG